MGFKRLSEVRNQETEILTLRITKAHLYSNELLVFINRDPEVLTSSKERKEHCQNSASHWFEQQLEVWEERQEDRIAVAIPDYPLEIVTCDVCPILLIDGKRYIASFLRDIWPVGWLIPGGCPSSFQELLDPRKVALRKLQEELVILDNNDTAYTFGASDEALLKILKGYRITPQSIIHIPIKEIPPFPGHAKGLRIVRGGEEISSVDNVNVTIDPKIESVAITLYCEIEIPVSLSMLRLFDGEFLGNSDVLIKRAVRLTESIAVSEVGEKNEAVAIFASGNNVLSTDWNSPGMRSRAIDPIKPFID